jgi:hypothetical protein
MLAEDVLSENLVAKAELGVISKAIFVDTVACASQALAVSCFLAQSGL